MTLAAGFKETEFVVHSLVNQCELLRVKCGGWHRPRSLLLDDVRRGEGGFTFAFCTGGELTVLRRMPSASGGGAGGGDGGPNWNMRMLNVWSHGYVYGISDPQVSFFCLGEGELELSCCGGGVFIFIIITLSILSSPVRTTPEASKLVFIAKMFTEAIIIFSVFFVPALPPSALPGCPLRISQ